MMLSSSARNTAIVNRSGTTITLINRSSKYYCKYRHSYATASAASLISKRDTSSRFNQTRLYKMAPISYTSALNGTSINSARAVGFTSRANSNGTTSSTFKFKPWPKSMIESNGDYTDESYLENEVIGGPLYEYQKKLPHLPVLSVTDDDDDDDDIMSKLLSSALPLAENEEEAKSFIDDCKLFPKQVLKETQLQSKLIERKENCSKKNASWLQLWWNQIGYLKYREPVIINVSYFFQLDDDPTLDLTAPTSLSKDINTYLCGIQRGAAALIGMAQYRKLVCSGMLPYEKIGKQQIPLCSTAFKYVFHSCRIPRKQKHEQDDACDTFKIYDPSLYKHCIVACRGQFYVMDFVNENNDPLPLSELERGLKHIVNMAIEAESAPELGILSSGHRDTWANTREELLQIGGDEMNEALTLIESGAFVLCLDEDAPVTRRECANIYWHGNKGSGSNRWFDKSINILCQSNGKLGFMGEHSLMDGMPMVALCNHVNQMKYGTLKKECNVGDDESSNDTNMPQIKNVFGKVFSVMDTNELNYVQELSCEAKQKFEDLIDNQELNVLSFQGYGSNYIKKSGYSPDSFVQMVMQLASYRLFGKQVGTYESSQTRAFLHGRTETIRSVSQASEVFVKAMGLYPQQNGKDDNATAIRKKKLALLKEATEYHSKYAKDASSGYGVDRYFFGLSMVANKKEHISLFSNPLFERSKTWRLSTSTLPNIPGFGPVVEDGLGIGYEVRPDCCFFTVTCRKKNKYTEAFCHLLEESLLEVQMIIELDKHLLSKL